MFAIRSTSEEECELDESVLSSVSSLFIISTAAEELVENTEKKINVSKEFVEVLVSSYNVIDEIEERPTDKEYDTIKAIKLKMDKLYSNIITSKDDEANIDNLVFLARAYLYLSCIYTNNRNNLQLDIAYSYIANAIKLLKEKETERKVILAAIDAHHLLGSLYHIWNKHEKSLLVFETALQLYLTYSEEDKYVAPINVIFGYTSDRRMNESNLEYALEKQSIMVLQDLLVAIRSAKKDNQNITIQVVDKIVAHKCKILKKILNIEIRFEGVECAEWALQLISLAKILIKLGRFNAAQNQLLAASVMSTMYYKEGYEIIDETLCPITKAERFDLYNEIEANINWYWAKYGIQLMQSSREKLSRDTIEYCIECRFQSTVKKSETQSNALLEFDTLQNSKKFIVNIPEINISSYGDAKRIFKTVVKHLHKAQQYFTFKKHRLMYVNIMRDTAYAYECFAIYEYQNKSWQVKLYKQQRKTLINITNKLDEKDDVDILKLIWIETASVASKILDIETVKLRYNTVDTLNTESLNDPNQLIQQIFSNWQIYLNLAS